LAWFEIVGCDLIVLVFETSVVTKVALFVLLALATPKVNLCTPLMVSRLGQVGVVIDPEQKVADELSIDAFIPRFEISVLDSVFPRVAYVTEFE
jgi:hypothetical protein